MKINAISNVQPAFGAKYREQIYSLSYPEGDRIITETKYKEYVNPKAKEILEAAKNASTPYERERILKTLGSYDIVNVITSTGKILDSLKFLIKGKK